MKKRYKSSKRPTWRLNEQIPEGELRVIGADNKQVGVLSRDKALKKAQEEDLDLIEIAPKAKPPVVKIADFGKFLYAERKKQKEVKKKTKSGGVKEMRFSPFIGDADYQTRLTRIKDFLKEKNKIRVVVKFKGRQMGSKKFGYSVLDKVLNDVGRDNVNIDMEPKFIGRHLSMVISPRSGVKKNK